MIINPYIHSKKQQPNTFIGGISGVVNTPALLADKLTNISTNDILAFKIEGADISFLVEKDYELRADSFTGIGVTFYNDSGRCKRLNTNCLANNPIVWAKFPGVTTIDGGFNSNVMGVFRNCTLLNSLEFGSLTTVTQSQDAVRHFGNTPALTQVIDTSIMTTIGAHAFRESSLEFNGFITSTVTTQFAASNNNPNNEVYHRTVPVTLQLRAFSQSPFKQIILNEVETISDKRGMFYNMPRAELIDMKKLKVFGNPSGGDDPGSFNNSFGNIKTGCVINVHLDLLTANSGNPDAALVWVKNNRSAVVNFYDDDGNYVSTL